MIKFSPKSPAKPKRVTAPMQETPGDYRAGSKTRTDFENTMSKPARQKDVKSGAVISPKTYLMKKSARKAGGFKGFKT